MTLTEKQKAMIAESLRYASQIFDGAKEIDAQMLADLFDIDTNAVEVHGWPPCAHPRITPEGVCCACGMDLCVGPGDACRP
jgi:hypothetical protein